MFLKLVSTAVPLLGCARVSAMEEILLKSADGPVSVRYVAARTEGKRPAVIVLHGRQTFDEHPALYTRYAEALAAKGIDAFIISYYSKADKEAMQSSDRAARVKYFGEHLSDWSNRVRGLVAQILSRADASGKVGLLGFSNGGFLAVLTAATEPRIDGLVVFYGGIAGPEAEIARLPPLLVLHGAADRVIPLSSGTALVERARALGGEAELVTYPAAGHVFDFDFARPDARDASDRALSFLEQRLK